ncbi:UxaA family hydrolase [Oxalobacter aliiformigenes]|uniref:UxaA family hydrolase n=1 Tax=Oxalobacter aliiformigenes TaxID=2946593 RepID=UPI0022AF679F|nr:UxaA family hydrolase [Oxalobacter aliiformigenes]MCZ4065757.1 UxaA family hydrolase [Oxalobacter aliiformigenes]WAV99864.1 UxaA family hydrolase [Oxalobacter aliiformigenes]
MKIQGFIRPDGKVGIRNYLLVVSTGRNSANLALLIANNITGAKVFTPMQEAGRTAEDRATIARTIVGLAKNPNVGAVLIVGIKKNGGYPEFTHERITGEISKSRKPLETVFIDECGGFYQAIGEGIKKGRKLAVQASEVLRQTVDFGSLFVGIKCGYSDPTSGLAGNPVAGNFADRLVDAGGSMIFSETTEVIGAEHILAKRFHDKKQRIKFLDAVARVENEAKSTGEDIRSINPIPANIEAGLSTLEEKSLGAIAKAGSRPIQECVKYGEPVSKAGLHFMDSWMSSSALFLGFAATGTVLNLFQVGGNWMPESPLMPSSNTGIVTPTLYMSGNPYFCLHASSEIDFDAGTVITSGESVAQAGERLAKLVSHVASGRLTKAETLGTAEPVEQYMRGSVF